MPNNRRSTAADREHEGSRLHNRNGVSLIWRIVTPATVVTEQREWISQSPRHRRSKTPKSRPRTSQHPLTPTLYRASLFSIPRYATHLRTSYLVPLLLVLRDFLSRLLDRLRRRGIERAARSCGAGTMISRVSSLPPAPHPAKTVPRMLLP